MMTVYLVMEHEPEHEYPCIVQSVWLDPKGAAACVTELEAERDGAAHDGLGQTEDDLYWEIEACVANGQGPKQNEQTNLH